MVLICSFEGVPRTLIISTNWSMPDSPGNNGDPVSNSAMTHPVDQISTLARRTKVQHTNKGGIVCCTKNKFGGPVISGTNITDVWFPLDKNLCAPEITQLENSTSRVQQEVLRFNIPMTYSHWMNIRQWPQTLVHVKFDLKHWHYLLDFRERPWTSIEIFGNIFEYEVEVHFTLLQMSAMADESKGVGEGETTLSPGQKK